MTHRRLRFGAALAVLLAGAATWYVSAPPKGSDGYRERMAEVTRTVRSQVQSARLWVEAFGDGDTMRAATAVGLREAETDAASAASAFEAYEPTQHDIRLRSRFVTLAARATGALADLRIAAQLEQWNRIRRGSADLAEIAATLERFEHAVRR